MVELSQAHAVFLCGLLPLQNFLVCVVAKSVCVMTACFALCVAGHNRSQLADLLSFPYLG